jgi:hypothetical protein
MSWVPVDDPGIVLPHLTLQTVIGISVALTGNLLISLALNLQKLAHLRLDRGRQNSLPDVERERRPLGRDTSARNIHSDTASRFGVSQPALEENNQFETQPLIPHRSLSQPPPSSYGLAQYDVPVAGDDARSRRSSNAARSRRDQRKRSFVSRFSPLRLMLGDDSSDSLNVRGHLSDSSAIPVEDVFPRRNTRTSHPGKGKTSDTIEDGKESDYLRSKLWFVTRDF